MAFGKDLGINLSIGELENANTDRSVDPAVMTRGITGFDETGTWRKIAVSSSNSRLLISGSLTATSAPLSADSSKVSAIQGDAGLLRISAIGGTAGDRTLVDGTTQTISATLTPISASPAGTVQGLVVNSFQADAGKQLVSAKQGDANLLHTSAFVDSGSVSAKNQDANFMHVSGFSPDSALFRVSAIHAAGLSSSGAANFAVSAASLDAGTLRTSAIVDNGSISAKSTNAAQLVVSATQADANLQHVSSYFGVDTTGQWTVGRLSNLSSSGNIKTTAGTVYGYYAYNTDKIINYINLTSTSGAINVGTDAVVLKIVLPPSAAANVGFPGGLKGFTAGIGAYATSAFIDGATTPSVTSAVGINVFFN